MDESMAKGRGQATNDMKIEVDRYLLAIVHRRIYAGFGWWRVNGRLAYQPWQGNFWFYFAHTYYDGDHYTLRIGPFFFTVHAYDIET